ncbi:hypothetical protein [Microbacterium sp. K24]|uniref:hypothetical protein n=1 Tax=Microbacterium sp. K24 TaxID=2305446 RepID=UPI00109C32E6|nr:hypothetical protein [Microbacterium sp. K24]
MQIQFDPFSFCVALIAVMISGRAYYLARQAPKLERVRQNRDAVRAALRSAEAKLLEAEFRLDEGRSVSTIPDEVEAAFEILKEYGPRLPEDQELFVITRIYYELRRAWRSVDHNDEMLASRQTAVSEAEAHVGEVTGTTREAVERARERLASARRTEVTSQRTLDAARTNLRESVKLAREKELNYIDRLDEADRKLK